jgi:hypothetical protein
MGIKCSSRDQVTLFEGLDRRNAGSIDLKTLLELVYPRGRGDRDREELEGRDEGRGSRRDDGDSRERGSQRVVLKRNEARVVLRKRPDLLQEVLLQMRAVNNERG